MPPDSETQAAETAKPVEKPPTSGEIIKRYLNEQHDDIADAKTNQEIADLVKQEMPWAATTDKSVASFRYHERKAAATDPNREGPPDARQILAARRAKEKAAKEAAAAEAKAKADAEKAEAEKAKQAEEAAKAKDAKKS